MAAAVLAVVFSSPVAAKKGGGGKPGGGGDPVDTGTIYYGSHGLWSMNPDGSGKTLLPVRGVPSMTRHPAEGDRWYLRLQQTDGFYPIVPFPPLYYWEVSDLGDLEAVGFTGDPDPDIAWGTIHYYIDIDGAGNPDTFSWYIGGGAPPGETGVPITGGYQELHIDETNYLTIKFGSTTGHAVGDAWWIPVKKTQRHELFAVREDGLVEVQLTDDPNVQPWRPGDVSRALPSWAMHDGVMDGKVSYVAQRWDKDGDEDVAVELGLYAVEIDWDDWDEPSATTVPTKVPVILPMSLDTLEIRYDWSPDGNSIVYSAGGIRVADAYGEPNEWLCGGGGPRWSPVLDDGSTLIAFGTGGEIRTIGPGPDGAPETTVVTAGKNRGIRTDTIYWSPNGTHLVYTLRQSKACNACQYNDSYDIYRVGVDGSDRTNLTNDFQEIALAEGWRD
jgi:hypothetical protein